MRGIIVVAALVLAVPSHADDAIRAPSVPSHADDAIRAPAAPESGHLVYVELLGKGGLYGIGYEYAITRWLGFGGAASYSEIRDEQVLTASPYLHVSVVSGRRHALFTEVGGIIAHARVPSPVMNWDGVSDTGSGGYLALGWEYHRRHVVVRTSGAVVAGEGGVAPMLGIAFGARP